MHKAKGDVVKAERILKFKEQGLGEGIEKKLLEGTEPKIRQKTKKLETKRIKDNRKRKGNKLISQLTLPLPQIFEEEVITYTGLKVKRKFVLSLDELKRVFEHYKAELKEAKLIVGKAVDGGEWWEGYTTGNKRRRIEYQPYGEKSTNEGPHVKIVDYEPSTKKLERKRAEQLTNILSRVKNMETIKYLPLEDALELIVKHIPAEASDVFQNEKTIAPFVLNKIIEKLKLQNKWVQLLDWKKVDNGDADFEEKDFYHMVFNGDDLSNDYVLISTIESNQLNRYFLLGSDNLLNFMTNYSDYLPLPILFVQPMPYLFIFLNNKTIYAVHDEGYLMKIKF